MRHNWIAVGVLILLAATSAALVKEQFDFDAGAGEETVSRTVQLDGEPNHSHDLSQLTEGETRYRQYLASFAQECYSQESFGTAAARRPAEQADERKVQRTAGVEAAPYTPETAAAEIYASADPHTFAYSDAYLTCTDEDTYDEGETTCYVDSVNGDDANDGLSEESPVRSQSAIGSSCTVVRFKRGSVFNEKMGVPTFFKTTAKM